MLHQKPRSSLVRGFFHIKGTIMGVSPVTFDTIDNMPDPMLDFRWVCTSLPNFGARMPPYYIEAVDIPFPEIQQKEGVFGAGTYSYYPGFITMPSFNITIYEDDRATALKWIEAWRRRIYNREKGTYYLPGQYKRPMRFQLFDNQNDPILEATLWNCWITTTASLALAYTSANRVAIQQSVSTDGGDIRFLK